MIENFIDNEAGIPTFYQLGRSLGKGQFGEVFYAEDNRYNPPRRVAIKVLYPTYVSTEGTRNDVIKEASNLARFRHPNILHIIDYKATERVAYIVTNWAEGGSLEAKIRPDPTKPPIGLALPQVAEYLEQIGEALEEAHTKNLIHRDIKLANILLDHQNRPMLADFGLSAVLSTAQTATLIDNDRLGTPFYMAPELWMGQVGKPSDVYALGVVAYQLLTGTPPFVGNALEVMGQHLQSEPPPIAHHRPDLYYPPALDAVIAQALVKNARQRLRSPREFARLFRAALNGEAVETPPASTVPSTSYSLISQTTNKTFQSAHPMPLIVPNIRKSVRVLNWDSKEELPNLPRIIKAHVAFEAHQDLICSLSFSPDGQYLASASADNTIRMWEVSSGRLLYTLPNHLETVHSVVFSPDGFLLASAGFDNTVRLWDVETAQLLHTFTRHGESVWSVAFSPDGRMLVSGGDDKQVILWHVKDKQFLTALKGHEACVNSVAFSPDGNLLATGGWDRTIRLWNMKTGKAFNIIKDTESYINSLEYSPDGKLLMAGCQDSLIRLWDVESGRQLLTIEGHIDSVNAASFSPDSRMLASGSLDKTLKLWTLNGPSSTSIRGSQEITSFKGHTASINSVVFSPDGTIIASAGSDNRVRLWKIRD